MEKLVITVAPTGAQTTRQDVPTLPMKPEEIADSVYAAYKAGAAVAHLHMRDDEGKPTNNFKLFERTVTLIRERCDILINVTTSNPKGMSTDEERVSPLALLPELCSFNAGSLNSNNFGVVQNSLAYMHRLARACTEFKVKPEIECFDSAMIETATRLAQEGLLAKPLLYQLVLGYRGGGLSATPKNFMFMLDLMPPDSMWAVVSIGRMNLPFSLLAISLGGHVRVGMEDGKWYRKGVPVSSNAQLVERIVRMAEELDRPVATVAEARKILHLPER